ncbi:MAG: GxxExxY protein [Lentisphaeraceae bacterium]|nr:GxxExxY protein [Lentisphaeraceae bacterium]
MTANELCDIIRQTAYNIHCYLGVGFLESVYENALAHRLVRLGLRVEQQKSIQVFDQDGFLIGNFTADLLVDERIIVELKAADALHPNHEAQVLNYLNATKLHDGLLINFGSKVFQIKKFAL